MQAKPSKTVVHYLAAFLGLVLVASQLFTSCHPSSRSGVQNAQEDTLSKIRRTKEMHVGYFLFEPTIKEDNAGNRSGVFIDLIEKIANSLDAKVVYHKVDLAQFAAGLQSDQYDVSIGATFATPQRATAVLFTNPIFYSGYTGVVPKDSRLNPTTWQELDRPGLKIAVKQGSAIDDFVRNYFTKAEIIRLSGPDLTLPLAAVSSGQADVGLMNSITVFTYLREHQELHGILIGNSIAPTYFSWAVRPNDLRWCSFLNTCIDYYKNTGDLIEWERKYGVPLEHLRQDFYQPTK